MSARQASSARSWRDATRRAASDGQIVARLARPGKPTTETEIEANLAAGHVRELHVVTGKLFGSKLTIKIR